MTRRSCCYIYRTWMLDAPIVAQRGLRAFGRAGSRRQSAPRWMPPLAHTGPLGTKSVYREFGRTRHTPSRLIVVGISCATWLVGTPGRWRHMGASVGPAPPIVGPVLGIGRVSASHWPIGCLICPRCWPSAGLVLVAPCPRAGLVLAQRRPSAGRLGLVLACGWSRAGRVAVGFVLAEYGQRMHGLELVGLVSAGFPAERAACAAMQPRPAQMAVLQEAATTQSLEARGRGDEVAGLERLRFDLRVWRCWQAALE